MRRLLALFLLCASLLGLAAVAEAQTTFTARLTGNQETPFPGIATAATGTALFELTPAGLQFYVTVEGLSGPITAASIQRAPSGTPGPMVRDILGEFGGSNNAAGLWTAGDAMPLTSSLIGELINGDLCVNIATAANPAGEIRGQMLLSAGVHLTANLQAAQENPGTGAAGTGAASFTLTNDGTLHYKITLNNLSGAITGSHFHTGAIGVNGGILWDITATYTGTSAQGFITGITPAQAKEFIAGDMYVNVHTGLNPGGEIRGQINLAGGFGFSVRVDQSQETPPTGSAALGTASATLTPAGLMFDLTCNGLTGAITGAHFHNAPAGVPGGIVRTFNAADFISGTTLRVLWRFDDPEPLTPKLIGELLNNRIYVNLHTAAFPGGEVRGQLLLNTPSPTLQATYTCNMTSQQEKPPIAAVPALGTGTFQLLPGGLAYRVTVDGLTGAITAAHFHNAPIGVGGGVVRGVLPAEIIGPTTMAGLWSPADAQAFTPALMTELIKGNLYFNVHTGANPGGECRGQILPASGAEFESRSTSSQETPPTGAGGRATGSFTLTPYGLAFNITMDGMSGALTGAHFHNGQRGVAGPVVRGFAAGEFITPNTLAGIWKPTDAQPLTPALVTELLKGNLYVNFHTALNPGGEIRGQVTLSGGAPFSALPTGPQEVPPTPSLGKGNASMTLTDEGYVFRLTNNGMGAPPNGAEFGNAPPGVAGPTVRTITPAEMLGGQSADGVWKTSDADPLTTGLLGELYAGNLFLDIDTPVFPAGEIRGQIGSPLPTVGVEDPPISGSSLELRSTPNPMQNLSTISFFLPRREKVRLAIYDVSGREVAVLTSGTRDGGWHRVSFDARGLSSGVYLSQLDAGALRTSRKILLMR